MHFRCRPFCKSPPKSLLNFDHSSDAIGYACLSSEKWLRAYKCQRPKGIQPFSKYVLLHNLTELLKAVQGFMPLVG